MMVEDELRKARESGRVKDARGRSVTQLDPIGMYLLRQHDVMGAEILRSIAHEKGVRITAKERAALIVGVIGALLVIALFTHGFFTGDLYGATYAKSASLIFMCSIPWVIWRSVRHARFNQVTAVMLKCSRCPHCGYDLRMLPPDPTDGATVCPECGCAWELESRKADDEPGADVGDGPSSNSQPDVERNRL
jgi:hypothetical protein